MAAPSAVWGIDIGQCALKAIKLRVADEGRVEAVAFDVIEHPKILSQPDADRDELIGSALEKFASRNDWQGDRFVIGVPGQQTFARFCKMPPIDLKKDARKIPELVRYEASQQIPFDMDDVVWDYQVFTSEETPDIEVGIFAIRKDLIRKHLSFFANVGIAPQGVQAVPAALYNFCVFDRQTAGDDGATVIIDVGAQNTDLIIVEANSAWTRNIPLGGNSFTEALVRAFKLSFAKAESLKRSAADSKYARQIFQAMRPVFADLVAEIQRSVGFYSSTHRDVELKKVLALGNAFLLPGLQKYLENNLSVGGGVLRLEKFNQIVPSATTNAPQFTENVLTFAAAYGLALQGLDLGRIHATLLPPELARIAIWRKKRPYFVATAAALLLAAGVPWVSTWADMKALEDQRAQESQQRTMAVINEARQKRQAHSEAARDTSQGEADIQTLLDLQKEATVLPAVISLVHQALPPLNPPVLNEVTSAEELRSLIASDPKQFERTQRGQMVIESLEVEYEPDLNEADLGVKESGGGTGPSGASAGGALIGPGMRAPGPAAPMAAPGKGEAGFVVRIRGRLLYGTRMSEASGWVENEYYENLRELFTKPGLGVHMPEAGPGASRVVGDPLIEPKFRVATGRQWGTGTGTAKEEEHVDPVTGEDARYDWTVRFAFKLKLGDLPVAEEGVAAGQ
jgi:type IV pilus assembly protein PilM